MGNLDPTWRTFVLENVFSYLTQVIYICAVSAFRQSYLRVRIARRPVDVLKMFEWTGKVNFAKIPWQTYAACELSMAFNFYQVSPSEQDGDETEATRSSIAGLFFPISMSKS